MISNSSSSATTPEANVTPDEVIVTSFGLRTILLMNTCTNGATSISEPYATAFEPKSILSVPFKVDQVIECV